MSVRSKLGKYISLIKADYVVFQPGRVGSTGVVKSLESSDAVGHVLHMHSAGLDRVYCVKSSYFQVLLNGILIHLLKMVFVFKRMITGEKTVLVVPLRDKEKRNRSVFIEYFEIIMGKATRRRWYREYYKSGAEPFLQKLFQELLEKDGQGKWLRQELRVLVGRNCAMEKDMQVVGENYAIKYYVFDISKVEDVFKNHLGIDYVSDITTNTTRRKWCYDFIASHDYSCDKSD